MQTKMIRKQKFDKVSHPTSRFKTAYKSGLEREITELQRPANIKDRTFRGISERFTQE